MKTLINTYITNKIIVDNFISSLMESIPQDYVGHAKLIIFKHKYIEQIYGVDSSYHQTTPIICKKKTDSSHIGSDKSHYFVKLKLDDEGIFISTPYIHHRTGKASISVVRKVDEMFYVFDINLVLLLEDLKLIKYNTVYDKIKRSVYFLGASIMGFVAISLIIYGGYVFFALLFVLSDVDFLHNIFKSIVAISLGLAVFDLAKQIFEHEVVFQTLRSIEYKEYKVLGKFLISIIIALSIEMLMVVFKIALNDDYSQMISAFYLIISTTIMFVGLAYFYKTLHQTEHDDDDC